MNNYLKVSFYRSSRTDRQTWKDAKIFTKLDLWWGYNQRSYQEGNQFKAALWPTAIMEPMVIVFGITKFTPPRFKPWWSTSLWSYQRRLCHIYMDDILIFSNTIEEHRILVKKGYNTSRWRSILETWKIAFQTTFDWYLGMIITHTRFKWIPANCQPVVGWPTPKWSKMFILFRIWKIFIEDSSRVSPHSTAPLTALTRKNTMWTLGRSTTNGIRCAQTPLYLCTHSSYADFDNHSA